MARRTQAQRKDSARELREARAQQAATAAILKVIARSRGDAQPVFEAIQKSCEKLFRGFQIGISVVGEDGQLHLGAYRGPGREKFASYFPMPLSRATGAGSAILAKRVVEYADMLAKGVPEYVRKSSRATGTRSIIFAPMLRQGRGIGAIYVARNFKGSFSAKERSLLKTFADQAVIAIENVRLFNETKEALERQTATSEVLKTISRSTFDLNAVLQVLIENATRLAGAHQGFIFRFDGKLARLAYSYNAPPAYREHIEAQGGFGPGRGGLVSRVLLERRTVHIVDATADPEFTLHEAQRLGGFRSMLGVPMMREGNLIGVIAMWTTEVRPFSEKQIELVSTFADQAVIAIENVRLFNETKEALERQTGTAEVLRVISQNPTDTQPVFDAILERATALCGAETGLLFSYADGAYQALALRIPNPAFAASFRQPRKPSPESNSGLGRLVRERRAVHIPDILEDAATAAGDPIRMNSVEGGVRAWLGAPLLKDGMLVGAIVIYSTQPRAFAEQHVKLLQTFADQAVIATENVRLFNETKQALERQTATAEILRVISGSPDDVQPVLEAVVDSAARLCDAKDVLLLLKEGDELRYRAHRGEIAPAVPMGAARRISRDWSAGRCAADARQLHIHDITAEPDEYPDGAQMGARAGYRTVLGTPLLREGIVLGVILMRRAEVRPFETRQIELINTFADQAVIAIENVRLFNETKEALERQTATADILRVIGSSPTDVQPVFEAIVQSGLALFPEATVGVALPDGKQMRMAALANRDPAIAAATRARFPIELSREYLHGAALLDARVVDIPDATLVQQGDFPAGVANFLASGNRAITVMPMVRGDRAIGTISVTRRSPGPLSEKQMALLRTFADQAVIAIENVRLFNETKEALERQTATAEILKVIAGSPADVQPVFDAIAQSANRLIGGFSTGVFRTAGDEVHLAALTSTGDAGDHALRSAFPMPISTRQSVLTDAIRSGEPKTVEDVETDPGVGPRTREVARARGFRSQLAVPMKLGDQSIGAINVTRREPGGFTSHQVGLLKTFADQAVIAIENVRLFNETKESLERQTATAEILRVIASSPSDVQPVFDAIAESAKRLLAGHAAVVARRNGDMLELAAYTSTGEAGDAALKKLLPVKITGQGHSGKAILTGAPVLVADVETDPDYSEGFRVNARARGFRSVVSVPMLREGEPIGVISVYRPVPGKFSEHQTSLLKTFADQAVIAIENVRLFNETKEALERQTATADVLAAISGAQTNVDPVFRAIARNAQRLCNAVVCNVLRYDGELLHVAASHGFSPADEQKLREKYPVKAGDASVLSGRVIATRQIEHIYDAQAEPGYDHAHARQGAGWRRMLGVPLLRDDVPLGVIVVAWSEPGRIPDAEIDLLKTFAAQASIAIENVRLFNETKESLAQQTATADILRVIGGSITETKPVFEAIVKSCHSLFGVGQVSLRLVQDGRLKRQASVGETSEEVPIDRDSAAGTCVLERKLIHLPDLEKALDRFPGIRNLGLKRGYHSGIYTPLLRAGEAIGTISVLRVQAGAFSDKEASLLQTFADQAVIAIENVRLFNETKEALERQTATAEILRVISSSPTDVRPVFDAIVNSGVRLFAGAGVFIGIVHGQDLVCEAAAGAGVSPVGLSVPVTRESAGGTAILERRVVNVRDTEAPDAPLHARENARRIDIRSMIHCPMFREGEAIGTVGVIKREPGGLDDKQLALLKTFADQAVIAIENVRLFKELQQREEALTKSVGQLTALGEVGQALSSTLELDKVLKTIVERAVKLTGLDGGSIYEYDEAAQQFSLQAAENMKEELVRAVRETPVKKGEGAIGRSAETLEPVQIADIADESYGGRRKELLIRAGYRAILAVPLLREGQLLGALQVFRGTPGEFAPEVVELLKTFATQSAMAIQNARLFREIAEKGRQLEVASRHKSQFLASMSHELRTPLNAILGFNEMILGEVYGPVPAEMKEPLTDIQTSGKHLLRLINNVLDLAKIEAGRMELALGDYSVQDTVESVRSTLRPLAAEKGLEFLASVPVDLPLAYGDAGRITQCLMNLAGNSLKFTKQGKVEIAVTQANGTLTFRVSDTGVGIPADKIGSLFTEFKQTDATIASEYGGTGLGLSISKKFVEMHGGRIWVESEPGRGSSFIFELPLRVKA